MTKIKWTEVSDRRLDATTPRGDVYSIVKIGDRRFSVGCRTADWHVEVVGIYATLEGAKRAAWRSRSR
jgi:hypothetical protein